MKQKTYAEIFSEAHKMLDDAFEHTCYMIGNDEDVRQTREVMKHLESMHESAMMQLACFMNEQFDVARDNAGFDKKD